MTIKRAFIQTGFTLIELLVTVIILAVLASMATVNYSERKKRNEYTSALAQARTIAAAEKAYSLTQTFYVSTGSTVDTNNKLAIKVSDGYFRNYRVNNNTAMPPSFNVTVFSGTASKNATYTFDSDGNRIACSGSDCLP
ncbi:MAG: prepilin-type N-terminal cleavage/methylation domain-containing protein [Candidatus Omnitrophota bacterium]